GWTLVESGPSAPGNCTVESLTAGAATAGAAGFVAPAATDGANVAISYANSPGSCQFFQDVVIPTGHGVLTYAAGYNYFDFVDPTGGGCGARVEVLTTANVLIASGFTASGATNIALAARPAVVFDVAPGSTVRVSVTADSCLGGPAGFVLDAV